MEASSSPIPGEQTLPWQHPGSFPGNLGQPLAFWAQMSSTACSYPLAAGNPLGDE